MKISTIKNVFRDTTTGMHYEKLLPSALIPTSDPGGKHQFGYVLAPCGDHPALDWDQLNAQLEKNEAHGLGLGLTTLNIFVTEEQLAQRFDYIGPLKFERDMEALVRMYAEENIDFEDREYVGDRAKRLLGDNAVGLAGAVWYTLLKEYLAKSAPAARPVFLNSSSAEPANSDMPDTRSASKENW